MNRSKLVFIIFLTAAALSLAAFLSCGDDDDDSTSSGQADDNAGDDDTSGEPFVLASVKFGPGDDIPEEYTCDNEDYVHGVSPPLSWANSPEETVFFALTMWMCSPTTVIRTPATPLIGACSIFPQTSRGWPTG